MREPHIHTKRGRRNRASRCANQCEVTCKNLLFENAPVSLWHEDFSLVQQLVDRLRKEGVEDFRSYFESHSEVVAECISLVNVLNVNLKTVKLHRAKSKEELTSDLSRIYTEESLPVFREKLISLAEGKNYFESEAVVKTLDGQKLHTLRQVLLDPETDDWSSVCVAVTDLTEQKKIENELKREHERLEALIQTIPDIIFFKDRDGHNLIVNKAYEKIAGIPQAEIIGKTCNEVLPRELAEQCDGSDQKILSSKHRIYTEEDSAVINGTRIFFETTKAPVLDEEGKITAIVGISRDITERKKAEIELKQYKEIVSSSTDMLAILNKEFVFLAANKAYLDAFDLTYDELVGMTATELFDEDCLEDFVKPNGKICLSGKQVHFQNECQFPAYGKRFMDIHYHPYRGDDGEVLGFVINGRDITHRKEAEEALRSSEQRFRTLIDHAPYQILIHDLNGKIIDANKTASRRLGYDLSELKQMTVWDINTTGDKTVTINRIKQVAFNKPVYFESKHRSKYGEVYPVEIHSVRVLLNEEELIVSSLVDISHRQRAREEIIKSEQRFRTLIDHAPYQILIHDLKGNFVDANKRACKRLGYNLAELKQMSVFDIDVLADEGSVEEHIQQIDFEEPTVFVSQHRSKSGEVYPVEIHAVRVMLNEEEFVVGSVVDISQRKQTEEENQKLQDQLRHSQKMEAVGQLAAGVAHEFNNVLVGVLSNAELLLTHCGKDLPERFREPVKAIKHSANLASDLTKQLLSFAHKKRPNASHFDINTTITKSRKMLQWIAGSEIKLVFQLTPDPLFVFSDQSDIERAITNLVINARDAMPNGGTLSVQTDFVILEKNEVAPDCQPGSYARLLVTDNGCGMSADVKERIFEPFFTTKPVGQGTGLGLSTIFADVTNSGGFITVESEENIGTAFAIHLPESVEEPELDSQESGEIELPKGGKETILICDDEEIVLHSVAALLEILGYSVLKASSPEDALNVAASYDGKISLLYTDVTMPEMSGIELGEKFRSLYPQIKVLLTSGYAEDILQFRTADQNEIDFIQKPAPFEQLAKRLREVLGE